MKIRLLLGTLAVAALAATNGDSKLLDAVKNQDMAAIRTLVRQKANVNAADVDGMTPLILAAHQDDLETVKLLLAAGANAKALNRYNVSALSEAANTGNGEMMEILLAAGADPNAAFGEGETALMTAARTGATRGVKALLAKGATVDAREEYRGQTALMYAASQNHPDVVKLLTAAGADVNAKSKFYEFSFQKVAAGGTQAVYSKGGLTPLMFAARAGALDSVKALIEAKADPNIKEDDHGFTPILDAIWNDEYDTAAYLADHGADLSTGALYLTVEMKNLDYFGNRPRKPVASKMKEIDFMKFLLAKGADANQPMKTRIPPRASQTAAISPTGITPFMRAARSADVETMKLLLANNADPNRKANDKGTAVIMLGRGQGIRFQGGTEAPEEVFLEALKLCVEKGADVNAANDRGDTAMHGAAARNALTLIQYLADHGAKLDAKNRQNRTPAMVALSIGGAAETGGQVRQEAADLIERLLAAKK